MVSNGNYSNNGARIQEMLLTIIQTVKMKELTKNPAIPSKFWMEFVLKGGDWMFTKRERNVLCRKK